MHQLLIVTEATCKRFLATSVKQCRLHHHRRRHQQHLPHNHHQLPTCLCRMPLLKRIPNGFSV